MEKFNVSVYGLTCSTEDRSWRFRVYDPYTDTEKEYKTYFDGGLWVNENSHLTMAGPAWKQIRGTCDFRVPASRSGVYKYIRRHITTVSKYRD